MKLFVTLSLAGILALTQAACSKQEATAPAATPVATAAPAPSNVSIYDTVASTGKGFTVGAMMSAQTVYVIFEPQCPHCGRLWQASLPLHNKVKFVWMPVSFSAKSLPQAVALMNATDPVQTMSAHEESLLGGKGGLAAPDNVTDEQRAAIKHNGELLTALGADSVPFLLAKHRGTGALVSFNGALDTAQLAQLLGVN